MIIERHYAFLFSDLKKKKRIREKNEPIGRRRQEKVRRRKAGAQADVQYDAR
jgi:hypothetical protein